MFTAGPALLASSAAPPPPPPGATWDPTKKGFQVVLSSGNKIANMVNFSQQVFATSGKSTGKFYLEIHIGAVGGVPAIVGFNPITGNVNLGLDNANNGFAYSSNGTVDGGASGASWTTGDVIGLTIDFSGAAIVFKAYKNNVLSTTKNGPAPSASWSPSCGQFVGDPLNFFFTLCTDAANQTYTPPAGFSVWGP